MTPEHEYPLFLAQAGKLADRRQAVTSPKRHCHACYSWLRA
jgi:hypothetical protein